MHLQSLFRSPEELSRYKHITQLLARYLCRDIYQLWKLNPDILA